jgi:hypothetical protein
MYAIAEAPPYGPQAQARQTHRQPATRSSDDGYTTASSVTLVYYDEGADSAVLGKKSGCVELPGTVLLESTYVY